MSYFTTGTRNGGETFTKLVDDAPQWLRDAVQTAHGVEMPNDWRYATCAAIWSSLSEYAVGECSDDDISDMADSLTDVYTTSLTTWLADDLGRVSLVDDVIEDGCTDPSTGLAGLLMAAQCRCIDTMAMVLRDARDENADIDETSNS